LRTPLPDTAMNQVALLLWLAEGPSAKIGETPDRKMSVAVRRSTDFFIDDWTA